MRRLVLLAGVTAIVYAVCSVIAGVLMAEMALRLQRRSLAQGDAARHSLESAGTVVRDVRAGELRAWYIAPRNAGPDLVLVLHGIGDTRLGSVGYARFFAGRGYHVLLPDLRAHGESGGVMVSYGVHEAGDVIVWAAWIEQNVRPRCIYAMGVSLGAAALLQSLRTEHRFCAVVADAPFASLRELAYDRVGMRLGATAGAGRTLGRLMIEAAFIWARLRYGADLDQADARPAIAATRVPVLLIHGRLTRPSPRATRNCCFARPGARKTAYGLSRVRDTTAPGRAKPGNMSGIY